MNVDERCDFCLEPEWEYIHHCEPFAILGGGEHNLPDYIDDGQWAACAGCHLLILAGNADKLFERSIEGQARRGKGPLSKRDYVYAFGLQDCFMEHRTDWTLR